MNAISDIENLPIDWRVINLEEHLDRITNGLTTNQYKEPPGIAVSRIETISDGTIDFERVRYIRELNEDIKQKYLLQKGDILFSHINSDLHLGKTAVYNSDKPLVHGMNLLLLRVKKETLNPYYLHYFLNYYRKAGKFIEIAQHAVNQSSLNQKKIKVLQLPLAPLIQQKLIVAEIEKQFSRLDEAVTALKRIQANLKRYKAAVLKAAVEGKLTEEWRKEHPDAEPASELLKRILNERKKKWEEKHPGKKNKEPAEPNTSKLPKLPKGWVWATVEQINIRPCAYGVLQPGPDVAEGVPLVRVGDINDGRIEIANLKKISNKIADKYPRTSLQGDEVLITLVGAIGRTATVPKSFAGANTARAVGVIPLTDLVNSRWVEIWFRNPSKIADMTSKAHEVARKTLNLEDVRVATIALPPEAEQSFIVDEIEQRLSAIEESGVTIESNLKRAERLHQSILKEAFLGGLIRHDAVASQKRHANLNDY